MEAAVTSSATGAVKTAVDLQSLRLGDRVSVRIEVPARSRVRRRLSDGRVVFVSPLASPFNYGFIPGTHADDGDPIDALLLGARLPAGSRGVGVVLGVIDFRDAGVLDAKVIVGTEEVLAAHDRRRVERFFARYAWLKLLLGERARYQGWLLPPHVR